MTEYLYRHRQINIRTIENIVNNKLSFSIGDTFNDPFDATSKIPTKFSPKSYSEFVRYNDPNLSAEEVASRTKAIHKALDPENCNHEAIVEIINGAISKIDYHLKNTYIACLNTNYREPLLWSHYADGHRGICLKFNKEKITSNDEVILSRKVDYNDEPIDIFREIIDVKSPAFKNYLFKKSSHWEYEEEYRLIARIARNETQENSKYLNIDYENDTLETIIFGAKCRPDEILTVMKLTKVTNVKYSRLTLSEMEYSCSEEIEITREEVENDIKNDMIYMDF